MLCANPTAFQKRVATESVISSVVLSVNGNPRSLGSLPSDPQERLNSVAAFFREVLSSSRNVSSSVENEFTAGNGDVQITVPSGTRMFALDASGLNAEGEQVIYGIWQIAVTTRAALEKR